MPEMQGDDLLSEGTHPMAATLAVTDPQTPSTEAGKALLDSGIMQGDHPDALLAILAIERQARASGFKDCVESDPTEGQLARVTAQLTWWAENAVHWPHCPGVTLDTCVCGAAHAIDNTRAIIEGRE